MAGTVIGSENKVVKKKERKKVSFLMELHSNGDMQIISR